MDNEQQHKIRESINETESLIKKNENLRSIIDNYDLSDDYVKNDLLKCLEVNISWLQDIKSDEESALI